MPFKIIRDDITQVKADIIVSPSNPALNPDGGVSAAIFKAAGFEKLCQACRKLAPVQTAQAVLTKGYGLPAKYIIHTVGPIYHEQTRLQNINELYQTYWNVLQLAKTRKARSLALPLIASGRFGFPKDLALTTAQAAIRTFLAQEEMEILLVVFDKESFAVSQQLLADVASYIDENYVDEHLQARRLYAPRAGSAGLLEEISEQNLFDRLEQLDIPFNELLLQLIDEKGLTDVQVYKKANLDRKLFSKIRCGKGYTPKKPTILALAIALELDLAETRRLLERAGYALSHASKFDVIIEYFIRQQCYDIFEINEVLFAYDQLLLGS